MSTWKKQIQLKLVAMQSRFPEDWRWLYEKITLKILVTNLINSIKTQTRTKLCYGSDVCHLKAPRQGGWSLEELTGPKVAATMAFEGDHRTLLLPDFALMVWSLPYPATPIRSGTVKKALAREEPVSSLCFILCTCSDINLCSLHTQNASGISFQ